MFCTFWSAPQMWLQFVFAKTNLLPLEKPSSDSKCLLRYQSCCVYQSRISFFDIAATTLHFFSTRSIVNRVNYEKEEAAAKKRERNSGKLSIFESYFHKKNLNVLAYRKQMFNELAQFPSSSFAFLFLRISFFQHNLSLNEFFPFIPVFNACMRSENVLAS